MAISDVITRQFAYVKMIKISLHFCLLRRYTTSGTLEGNHRSPGG